MGTGQLLIIIFISALSGWFISWFFIKILFWPIKPVNLGLFKIQGVLPAKQKCLGDKIGKAIQDAFMNYDGLEEKVSDPALLEKLKPQIEDHVDHFLKEKLKAVFPILAQFMGEKTISQFKTAFLIEIDNLFPLLMKNYVGEIKSQLKLDQMISKKINQISAERIKEMFYVNAARETRYMMIAGALIGLFTGLIIVLLLSLFTI